MKKYCTHVFVASFVFGDRLVFECTKRPNHFGRHRDAYGGTWKESKK